MSDKNEDLDRYLEDLSTIKKTVANISERAYVEPWLYFVWAGCHGLAIIGGVLLHRNFGLTLRQILVGVWIPLVLICGVLETVSAFRIHKRENRPLFSDVMNRSFLTMSAVYAVMFYLVWLLAGVPGLPLAGILLFYANIPIAFLAQISYRIFFINAYASLGAGLFLLVLHPPLGIGIIIMGVFTVINMGSLGVYSAIVESRKRKEHV